MRTDHPTTSLPNHAANVLLVDDDSRVLRAMQRILSSEGFAVSAAQNVDRAMKLLQERSFSVAIVDHNLPDRTGLSLLKDLMKMQPACVRVMASGEMDLQMAMGAVNEGHVSAVLSKPFVAEGLASTVRSALGERSRLWRQFHHGAEKECLKTRTHMDECLTRGHLRLALQPILAADDGRVEAYEALLRSTHEHLSGPAEVLSAAMDLERMHELADVVWSRAAEWMPKIAAPTRLFLNVHPSELGRPDLLERRAQQLAPWASRVVIELTEQSSVLRSESWRESLSLLSQMGFELAVDDLGAGYSSLSLLADLQPQFIKLDMSIVRGVHLSERKQRLVALLCRFADASRARIIAEGIEEEEEARTVTQLGAHLLQGYLLGKPSLALGDSRARACQ